MNDLNFTFSDSIAGYVTSFEADKEIFTLKTSDSREYRLKFGANLYAEIVRNLGEPFQDATGHIKSMITPGRYVQAYGVFYPEADGVKFEVKHLKFFRQRTGRFQFREAGLVGETDQPTRRFLRQSAIRRQEPLTTGITARRFRSPAPKG